jgi:hypothetical protein
MEFTTSELLEATLYAFLEIVRMFMSGLWLLNYHEAIDFNAPRSLILKNKMEVSSQWHMLRFKDNPSTWSCEYRFLSLASRVYKLFQ